MIFTLNSRIYFLKPRVREMPNFLLTRHWQAIFGPILTRNGILTFLSTCGRFSEAILKMSLRTDTSSLPDHSVFLCRGTHLLFCLGVGSGLPQVVPGGGAARAHSGLLEEGWGQHPGGLGHAPRPQAPPQEPQLTGRQLDSGHFSVVLVDLSVFSSVS